MNPKAEILPPRSRVANAIEIARRSAEAASERCIEAHRTAIATLDQSGPETLRDVIASADPATAAQPREAILAGMKPAPYCWPMLCSATRCSASWMPARLSMRSPAPSSPIARSDRSSRAMPAGSGTIRRMAPMRICAWFAGVDPERLAAHRSASRYLVIAIGMALILVTGPTVMVAMGSFAYGSLPEAWGVPTRLLIAVVIGLLWMMAILTIDRALLISADAIPSDRRGMLFAGLALRIGLAAILASLFSEMAVKLLYADILNTTAQHLALDQRERDAARLTALHGIPAAQKAVAGLEATKMELAEKQKVLPEAIRVRFAHADACDRQARQIAIWVNRDPTPERWRALSRKRAACQTLRSQAVHERHQYLEEIAAQIRENDDRLHAAQGRAETALTGFTADRQKIDAGTASGYASMSARDVAFESLLRQHPEVRFNVWLWWTALLIFELLPVTVKILSRNNPVAAEAQADLTEGLSQHRLKIIRLRAFDARYEAVLARPDVQQAIDEATAEYTVAANRVTAFREFIEGVAKDHARQRDLERAAPDLAARAHAAYLDALAQAFESIRKRQPFPMAAE